MFSPIEKFKMNSELIRNWVEFRATRQSAVTAIVLLRVANAMFHLRSTGNFVCDSPSKWRSKHWLGRVSSYIIHLSVGLHLSFSAW